MFTGGHHSFHSAQEPPALRRVQHWPSPLGTFFAGRTYSLHVQQIRRPNGFWAFARRTRNTAQIRFPALGIDPLGPNRVFNALGLVVKRQTQGSTLCPPTVCQDTARDISEASEVVLHVNSITLERFKCPNTAFKSS